MTKEARRGINPADIERQFSTPATLMFGGSGLLLNQEVIVSADKKPGGKLSVHVYCPGSMHLVTAYALATGGLREFVAGEKRVSHFDWWADPEKNSTIYIGDDYKITILGATETGASFTIESTKPSQTEKVDRPQTRRGFYKMLQSLQKVKSTWKHKDEGN